MDPYKIIGFIIIIYAGFLFTWTNSKPHFVWNNFKVKFIRKKLGDDAAEKILYGISILIAIIGGIMVII
ncbi:MAG: hypothetical protein R6U59_07120 [Eubacteriales bacterium]